MTMEPKHYLIKAGFAHRENLPSSFVATVLKETARAYYVYGHGALDPTGHCCHCGRTLTHPGSILLGIGPVCIGSWSARDIKFDNITEEDKAYLKRLAEDKVVDKWIPKSIVKKELETEEKINVPIDHKMVYGIIPKGINKPVRRAVKEADKIRISFPYDAQMVKDVKTLPGRRYNPDNKSWVVPIGVEAIEKLQEWGFEIDPQLLTVLDVTNIKVADVEPGLEVPGLKGKLYPFQEQGVSFLNLKDGRALIGDEMGLGKTIQGLAYIQLKRNKNRGRIKSLVICPASLKLNWKREAEAWLFNPKAVVLSGKQPYVIMGDLAIINYDVLESWIDVIRAWGPEIIITDECHYYKSSKAKRTKAVKMVAKGVPHFIALSGTPIVNRPVEIYNALSIINSAVMPSFWDYAHRYCGAKNNGYGWDFTGATNTQELHEKLNNTIMIRRKKADVLKDLPDKVRSFIPFELSNEEEYTMAEDQFIKYIKLTKGEEAAHVASAAEQLAQIEALKQCAVRGKLDGIIEWVRDFLESGEKLVLFATHRFVIDRLMQEFKDQAVKIDGSVSSQQRDYAVRAFQSNPNVRLFVGNIKAAGIGITLTAASNVAFIELPWTPGELVQAEDRCHRIGQKDSVNIYYLLAEGTIDEDIAKLLDRKRKILDRVLDGEVTEEESLLSELMNRFYK